MILDFLSFAHAWFGLIEVVLVTQVTGSVPTSFRSDPIEIQVLDYHNTSSEVYYSETEDDLYITIGAWKIINKI